TSCPRRKRPSGAGRCSTSGSEAPGSTRCRCARCSTRPPPRGWASGPSTPTSAASSAARTAMRGTRIAMPWSGAAPPRSRCRHGVSVNISLATLDCRLARRLELRSPVPAARIRALGRLTAAGIHAGLLVAPIIPGITDDRAGLGRLMGAAKEAGARYVVGSALRLGPAARHRFLPVLAREFPELADRYARHYARSEGASPAYQRALARRLQELQRRHGFPLDEGMKRHRQLEGRDRRAAAVEEQPLLF